MTSIGSRRSSRSPHQHDADTPSSAEQLEKAQVAEQSLDQVDEHDYLHGFRLVFILSGFTFATFLMLLDASIVATVSWKVSCSCVCPAMQVFLRTC